MNCKKCGNVIKDNSSFCSICGEKNEKLEVVNNSTNKSLTINNNESQSKRKNIILVIIVFVIVMMLMFIIGFFVGKTVTLNNNSINSNEEKNKNDSSTDNIVITDEKIKYTHNLFIPSKIEKEKSNTEFGKNITIGEVFFNPNYDKDSKYKYAYIYGKNDNSVAVDLNIILEYFDSEGYRIEKSNSRAIVKSGKEFVFQMTVEDDSINYSKVKLSYEANKIKSYYTDISDKHLTVTSSLIDDKDINILVENKYNEDIQGFVACLYYKNKKLVFAQRAYLNIKANQKSVANCWNTPLKLNDDYNNSNSIEYDDFNVVLYSAYNYDDENY